MCRPTLTFVAIVVASACNLGPSVGLDGAVPADGAEETDAVSDALAADAHGTDGAEGTQGSDVAPAGGPLTLIAADFWLLSDRLCDLDSDGLGDNALADMASPSDELLAAALRALIQGNIDDGMLQMLMHYPWIDDLSIPDDPAATAIFFDGNDADDPNDASDDFSGEEPFYITGDGLDACGEPLFVFHDMSIEQGRTEGFTDVVSLPGFPGVMARQVHATGTFGPFGEPGELVLCALALVQELGLVRADGVSREHSILELFLSGGAILGVPSLSGISPDLDLDGDGLERLEVDEGWHILRCIDGDGTVIAGQRCFQDERMADGFSLTWRLETVTAGFAGREPGWEAATDGTCDAAPESSVLDPR